MIVSRPHPISKFISTLAFGLFIIFVFAFRVCCIEKRHGELFFLYDEPLRIISMVIIDIIGGSFVVYLCLRGAREITVTEEGIRIKKFLTKKVRLIKYHEIRKMGRALRSERDWKTGKISSARQLELELKGGKTIIFEERELINLLETEKYICARISR